MPVVNISSVAELVMPPRCDFVVMNFFRLGDSQFDEDLRGALEGLSKASAGGSHTEWGLTVGMDAYDFGLLLKRGGFPAEAMRYAAFIQTTEIPGFGRIKGYGTVLAEYCLDGTGLRYGGPI
ncbi:MAG: hypothetical protein HY544_00990 [Candidatus Diapherotrites archaeon]|uniref:Uncharacterized protein n=1 Tax=Candidatus Iainarchaeum sp. TaxID=3101447 RepID=A0A8T3YKE6_9ARCH|nr:hypothetical protein [Candidatus Diapherotrites archaeon]